RSIGSISSRPIVFARSGVWFITRRCVSLLTYSVFFFKQKTAYEIGLGIPAEPLFRSLILNSFLGSSDSLVFSELFHSLAPRPLAARSISDFLLTYLAT